MHDINHSMCEILNLYGTSMVVMCHCMHILGEE